MEMILSALLGELVNRSTSFLLGRCAGVPARGETVDRRLQRMLLRGSAVVEEADRRRVANQAMLLQLAALREAMYRGYLALDTFRFHASLQQEQEEEEAHGHGSQGAAVAVSGCGSLSRALSALNLATLQRSGGGGAAAAEDGTAKEEVELALRSLEDAMADMTGSLVFLMSYPIMYRQPYSVHLFMDKCMFGRQAEMERIISFLLRPGDPSGDADRPDVLPIVGPRGSGRTTLVEHVRIDERVRGHFSRIIYFSESDLKDKKLIDLINEGVAKHHRSDDALDDVGERSLAIIELVGDVDEDDWTALYLACKHCIIPACSKVIVTSPSDKITSVLEATTPTPTQALALSFLPREAYWYFFKVRVFGSTDPEEQPVLTSIAMGIFEELCGTFLMANIISSLLRAKVSPRYWRRVHARVREWREKNLVGAQPRGTWSTNTPMHLRRIDMTSQHWVIRRQYYQVRASQGHVSGAVPIQEAVSRSVKSTSRVEIVAWRSQVPPCHTYMFTCEVLDPQRKAVRKRRIPRYELY